MASKKISLTKPKYQQIAVDVAEKIAEGKLHVGDKIHALSLIHI
ncbi:GntR family transcriptional regulator, partial [Enterococcus sp. S157_ASV_20]|nr:GntR family transcriptional regulator [Enterococcus sp. S157_ASV_20]